METSEQLSLSNRSSLKDDNAVTEVKSDDMLRWLSASSSRSPMAFAMPEIPTMSLGLSTSKVWIEVIDLLSERSSDTLICNLKEYACIIISMMTILKI